MIKRLISILLALLMTVSVSAFAESTAAPQAEQDDPVLASVNGVEITKSMVERYIPMFLDYQYILDATDYQTVVTSLVQQEIINKKIADLGFDKFTQEEEDSFASEAKAQWDEAIGGYADYLQSADTEEARLEAVKQAEGIYAAQGISTETMLEDIRGNASFDRLRDYLLAGYEPSEEEIDATFKEVGASYQEMFENNIPQYEDMMRYSGQSSWYTPTGYRGVIHILLDVDDALLQNYLSLVAAFEEQSQNPEVPVAEDETESEQPAETAQTAQPADATAAPEAEKPAVTQAMLDEAKQAILDSRKADIDMIYERLGRGESFTDLIKEYGTDPGMTQESNLTEGYPVHPQSINYIPEFTQAAFSEKMKAIGDVSDPVVGPYGIHILQYLRDIPSGLIMTDAIHQEIADYLINLKTNELFSQSFATWEAQENVVYNQEAIDKASQEAAASVQSTEELPLEALPETEDAPGGETAPTDGN